MSQALGRPTTKVAFVATAAVDCTEEVEDYRG